MLTTITRRRRRHRKSEPYQQASQWDFAYRDLLLRGGLRATTGASRTSTDRKVKEVGLGTWIVSGGECAHKVTLASREGPLICLDHTPTHPPTKPGYACCHILAVYKILAWDHIPKLFTPDGFPRKSEKLL